LRRGTTPKSVGSKLALVLVIYTFVGCAVSFGSMGKTVFVLSLYLHSMTLVFLGMFVAASAGEVLFNKDEGDILMHRPVTPQVLLWAKVSVIIQVSLWLAGAFNLGGFFVGMRAANPGWLYLPVHAFSTVCQALFCAGGVVVIYQLCLRWFGRERLDSLMTFAQVFVAIAAVVMGQIPQFIGRMDVKWDFAGAWWVTLLPSAWFAGIDDALAGDRTGMSMVRAAIGLTATGAVLVLAFGKLARDYQAGLQTLGETTSKVVKGKAGRRWIDKLVKTPPLSWWLRDSVERASFLLTAAYLMRDRDVKLRVYPGLAPMLVMPFIFLLQESHSPPLASGGFSMKGYGVAFAGAYLGLIPYLGLKMLRYSQQWQAADLFRFAPVPGPVALCHGARRAVLCFLTFPLMLVFAALCYLLERGSSSLALLIPGLLALPIYALAGCLGGKAVPLSLPTEEGKAAGRGLGMIVVMMISAAVGLTAVAAWSMGWFKWLLIGETIAVIGVYTLIRTTMGGAKWDSME
jgi:hypothetical protein